MIFPLWGLYNSNTGKISLVVKFLFIPLIIFFSNFTSVNLSEVKNHGKKLRQKKGICLGVQELRLCTLIPSQGTKIPHTTWPKKKIMLILKDFDNNLRLPFEINNKHLYPS